MKAGIVTTYVHGDNVTENKGAAVAKVTCRSDFAARTPQFGEFAKRVAKLGYAASFDEELPMAEQFPEIEDERKQLERDLKEEIVIEEVLVSRL